MSFEKVILESPTFQRILANREREATDKAAHDAERATVQKWILHWLHKRFGPVPQDLAVQLHAIQDQQKLDMLHEVAEGCADLDAFRTAMEAP